MSAADVFISYASVDRHLVHPFVDWLSSEGFRVWLDRDQIRGGQYFGTEIVRGLTSARAFVLMCSPNSMQSRNVWEEVQFTTTVKLYTRLPIWLTPVSGGPDRVYPPEIALHLQVNYLQTANRPAQAWYADARDSLINLGIQPASPPPPPSPEDYGQAVAARDWSGIIRLGEQLLRQYPRHPDLESGVTNARGWLETERANFVAQLLAQPTPPGWDEYLTRYPDGALADHAKFRLAGSLAEPQLGSFIARCVANQSTAWQIAESIARLRLKDRKTALAKLDQLRVQEPGNAAVAYFRAVALVASFGVANLSLERLTPVNEMLELCWKLSPSCGYPWLLAEYLARRFYEARSYECPFGKATELNRGLLACGLTPSDQTELAQMLQP